MEPIDIAPPSYNEVVNQDYDKDFGQRNNQIPGNIPSGYPIPVAGYQVPVISSSVRPIFNVPVSYRSEKVVSL